MAPQRPSDPESIRPGAAGINPGSSEELLKSLSRFPEENPFPVLRIAGDGTLLYANRGSGTLLADWGTAIGQRVPERWGKAVREILGSRESPELECRAGKIIYALTAVPVEEMDYVNFFGRDVTERKKAEKKLLLDARVFENASDGILITDSHCRILDVNRAFSTITGYSREEVLGKDPRLLNSGRHDPEFYRQLWDSVRDTGSWQGEIWDRRKNGEIHPKWLTVNAVSGTGGETTHYIGVFTDLTDKKQAEEHLYRMSHFDSLTGLANRRSLRDKLEGAVAQARRDGRRAAALIVDLDRFKLVNTSYGHRIGDALLREAAERLEGSISPADTAARTGGDEFALVLSGLKRSDEALQVAQRALQQLQGNYSLDSRELFVTASAGIALYPYDGMEGDTLLSRAAAALQRAKQMGGGTIQFFSPQLNRRTSERLRLHARLRRAVENEALTVYYQPQIDLESRTLLGAEALLRWEDSEEGFIPPDRFIPVAEETGLIHALGEFVLREVCRQYWLWRSQGLEAFRVAVNLSAQQLKRPELGDRIAAVLAEERMPAEHLELELTESMLVEDLEETVRKLRRFKDMGLTLAIDDFGTGYSSLSYLKRLPIDRLKIDKSFILGVPDEESDAQIAAAVIAMGRSLCLEVLAEGVETPAQVEFLRNNGCRYFQGYFCSPPVPPADLAELIRSGHCLVAPGGR